MSPLEFYLVASFGFITGVNTMDFLVRITKTRKEIEQIKKMNKRDKGYRIITTPSRMIYEAFECVSDPRHIYLF